ncbi:hypothetical protein C5167_013028 [Papaver somniferum]|uniref:Major facilitator superfamily (MFS) profile domain-containing protein n=1 Tax=Papaver somniferum TaxID=3469 RepID=A0A4Y7J2K4_PAPSO|nr:probable inositol transporter 2 [Papaver somniferum]RZC54181.1 hypothetical protein C5167_013028 [Papaver somniferum]
MLTTSLIPQKQEDNQEQSYYLDLHGHDTTLLRKRFLVIVVALVACIGASICGYYTAIIYASFYAGEEARRPPWKYLREIDVTDMLCIHAAAFTLGALTLDKLNDSGGRLVPIASVDFIAFTFIPIGWCIGQDPFVNFWGLVFIGWAVGMVIPNLITYVSEISPPSMRGALVSTIFLQFAGGKMLYHLINLTSSTKDVETSPWKLGIVAAVIHFIVCAMMVLPESPRWLYRKGQKAKAVETLHMIRSAREVSGEVEAMESSMEAEIAKEGCIEDYDDWCDKAFPISIYFKRFDIRGRISYKRIFAGIGCLVAQQFVGMNMIMHLSYTVFNLIGPGYITKNDEEMAKVGALAIPLITSALSVVGIIFCTTLVDRCGRRRLLLVSMFGILTSLGLLSYVFRVNGQSLGIDDRIWYDNEGISPLGLLALVALAMYMIFYSLGIGTVPWIITSEIYPMKYRAVCAVIGAMAYWGSKLLIHHLFLDVVGYFIGITGTLLLLQLFSWLVGLFIYLYVPETMGFPLEDVEKLLLQQEKDI